MDKNPDPSPGAAELASCAPGIVLCTDAFHKAEMVGAVARSAGCPVIVVDSDLLYTGYVRSGMMPGGAELVNPGRGDWRAQISGIASRISEKRHVVILDSFNGAYNMLGSDAFGLVSSSVMLLACAARDSGSAVVASAMARRREDGRWALLPGGRGLVGSGDTATFLLKKAGDGLALARLDASGNPGSETPL